MAQRHGTNRGAALALTAMTLTLMGCASSATIRDQPSDSGAGRIFAAPYTQTVEAVIASMGQLRVTPAERHDAPQGHTILFGRAPHGFSWGEVGRILVERSDAAPTTVRVIYEKRFALQFASSRFPRNLFATMDKVLAAQGVNEPSRDAPPASDAAALEPAQRNAEP